MSGISKEEEQGIKMIQFLQKLANIDESRDKALNGWRGMSENERKSTSMAYKACGGK